MTAADFASPRWSCTPAGLPRTFTLQTAFPPPPPPPTLFFQSMLPQGASNPASPENTNLLPPSFLPPAFSPPPFASLSISPNSMLSPAAGLYPPAVSATFPPPPAPTYSLSSPSYSNSSYEHEQRSDSSVSPISSGVSVVNNELKRRSNTSFRRQKPISSPKRTPPQGNIPLDPDLEFVDIPASKLWPNRSDSECVCFDRRNQLYCIYRSGMIEYPSGEETTPNTCVYPPSV